MEYLGVTLFMGFENLQKLGKEIYSYFTSFFTENNYFFLSVNPKIFSECIQRANLNEKDVISELKDSYTYVIQNEFVRLSVAAFQVKTFFEVRDKEKDNLLDALASIYDTNNIYTKFFNQSGNNNQERLWVGENLSVTSYFKRSNLNLFSQINDVFNQSKDSRYDTLKYVRYPETQLFFLANNIYKNELTRVCQKLKFTENDSLNDIYRTLKLKSNYSCSLFLNSLKIQNDFSPDNYRKILAFSIFVYVNSNSFQKDINTIISSTNITNTIHNYSFEILKYEGKWVLNVYEKDMPLEDSCDDTKAYSYLIKEISDTDLTQKIFIEHVESEYETDSEIYIQLKDNPNEIELFTPCILLSYTEIPSIQNYRIESNFLSKDIRLYKFDTVDECYSLLSTDNETAATSQLPLISQFKGGIRIGKNSWLFGCEPKIPDGCNIDTFKKEPAVYRIKKDNLFTTIEIIDSTPINDSSYSRIDNCGWSKFGLPSIFGFDIESESIFEPNSYTKKSKKYNNPISFHNLNFRGFFDGERIIPEKAELGINGMVSIEDNYQFKDYQKELLKNKKILSTLQLEIGQEYEFKLTYNPESGFIVPRNLTKTNNKPFSFQIVRDRKLCYKKYIKKSVATDKKVSPNILFYFDFTINEIIANAIRLGAAYKEIDFTDNAYTDNQNICNSISEYFNFAKNKNADFFLVFRNITDIKACQEKITPAMNQIPENVLIFFELQENINNSYECKDITYSISDEDYFIKQNQIKTWLNYVGFANWNDINHKCIELLNGDSQNIQEQYGRNPIYRLFYPLISAGEVEFIKVNNDYGFTLIKDFINLEDTEENQRKALDSLRKFPSVISLIKSWGLEDYDISKHVYPKNAYGFLHNKAGNIVCVKVIDYLTTNKYILFKEQPNTSPHLSTYFGLLDEEEKEFKIFRVPENLYEAVSYCNCLIHLKKEPIFKYNLKEKSLSCSNYGIIPALLQRILILFDVNQLKKDDIYMPYRNYKPFTNIPYDAIKYLKKIFGDNAVQEF